MLTKNKSTKHNKPKSSPRLPKWAMITIAVLALVAIAYAFLKPKPTPPSYLTADAVMGDIESTVMASGKVKPIQSVDVGSEVSGRVIKLYVKVGDEVKKGDLIAQISQVEQKNALSNAKATLEQAQAGLAQATASLASSQGTVASQEATLKARLSELNKAKQFFDRMNHLVKIDAVSRQDYDDAKIALEVAQANVEIAHANIQNAKNDVATAHASIKSQQANINKAKNELSTSQENLNHTTIVAPMDGMVSHINQEEGTTVNANQSAPTIVTITDLSKIRIKVQISEADVIHVKVGMPAKFSIIGEPDTQYNATLTGIEPESQSNDGGAVYYIGYLDVDNNERKFRINMTTQVAIIKDRVQNVLTIPSSALVNENGKYSVRVIGTDGQAKAVPVEVGLNNRINAEIKSGLSVGDKIVIGEKTSDDTDHNPRKNRS
ncbi:efflux RND transporter periplasmic adaptor subunit [Moraxella nasovis]|uniref:efflux RND transporter periplasmic adaptor subunit n=1 Tax=Moraxella nasovis TaxID=2904121 RepID=UPI001F6042C1|nr:efflux RND transporter periplasmic adaptor subunit [Moraxella nasovis]UNU72921.1 efflux RND transporter periplasmic adaptor subunit [Moraxella nasovis]